MAKDDYNRYTAGYCVEEKHMHGRIMQEEDGAPELEVDEVTAEVGSAEDSAGSAGVKKYEELINALNTFHELNL